MAARPVRSRPRYLLTLLAASLMIGCDANPGGPSVPSESSATDADVGVDVGTGGGEVATGVVFSASKGKGKVVRGPKEIQAAKPY